LPQVSKQPSSPSPNKRRLASVKTAEAEYVSACSRIKRARLRHFSKGEVPSLPWDSVKGRKNFFLSQIF